MKKKIPVIAKELSALPHVPITALQPLQGNLKDLSEREYNKLKKSLITYGIIVPFFVWEETGKLLDGHQRQRVFTKEGWLIDVPVVYISADNEQDAKQKLLVISSQYGRITQEGFDEFTYDLSDDWIQESVHFDALPFVFGEYRTPDSDEWAEGFEKVPTEDRAPFQQMTFTLHDSQVETIKEGITISKGMGKFDTENENSNGNALARICEVFITSHG